VSSHRLARATGIRLTPTDPPFSNFDFVDGEFGGAPSIRRLFSQARSYGGRTLVVEDIPATGTTAVDDAELLGLFPDFQPAGLRRLSFWKGPIESPEELSAVPPRSLLGFAILKRDSVPSRAIDAWYVFESVLVKYPHQHNCVRGASEFRVCVGDREFSVAGVLYCQQNRLNKACAQVALRSLLATLRPDDDLSYGQINEWAADGNPGFDPGQGLEVPQIQRVFRARGVGFFDIDYGSPSARGQPGLPPYQKLVYAGVESGSGALLGFRLSGPGLTEESRHIIPFFGHTFNQDTWVPHAEMAYFHVGERTRYLPSEAWVSSFIGHDDNFGSNFCVPRQYVSEAQADYVAEILLDGCAYSGAMAEAVAVDHLYSILPELAAPALPWLSRLIRYVRDQQVVLRAVCVSAKEYLSHWRRSRDWDGNAENRDLCQALRRYLPRLLWVVEVPIPELFPANLRKVGEIVLDASSRLAMERDFGPFVLARVPGRLLLPRAIASDGTPSFVPVPSQLLSHTPLLGCETHRPGRFRPPG